ncbi:TatD family hydrolase [Ammoniphilus sp. 3BR4]|uniref:TatD family hydrolase n=1 Tax=Ammoniphilus sp. 3BR4 TaxID=3158265 RepID=UPI00346567F2
MYFDAHIHLDQYPLDHLKESIEQWRKQNVQGVLAVSTDLRSSYQTLELKLRYPDFIFAAVGYHPELPLPTEQERLEISALVKQERRLISAIGEVGLPHYEFCGSTPSDLEPFLEVLRSFSDLAIHYQLPLILHAVHDKAELAFSAIQKQGVKQAHFHWLKAPTHVVKQIAGVGYFISVTPEICYRTRDQEMAKQVPLSQLLIETDGPWKYGDSFQNVQTTPLLLADIALKLAEIHQLPLEQMIQACWANTHEFLQIKK